MTSIRTATQLELFNLIQYLSMMISAATTPATMMMDSARSAISSTITRASATSHSLLAGYLAASTNSESGSAATNASSVPDACLPIIRAALESLASCVRAADHDHSDPTQNAPLSPYLTLAAVSLAYLDSASTASGVPAFAHAHASLAALVNVCSASTECVNPAPATRSVLDSLIAALGSELVSRVLSLPEYDSEDIRDKLDSAWSSRVGSPEPVEQVEQLMETVADEAVAVKAALPASDVEDNDEE